MKTFSNIIKEAKYFEGTQIVQMTKELCAKYLNDIKELNIRERELNEYEWHLWSDKDIMMDLPMKWEMSYLILLGDKFIGSQINTQKETKDGEKFIHTNRVIIDKDYRNFKLLWELYQKLYDNCKKHGFKYCTCFTPSFKVKELNTNILGMELIKNGDIVSHFITSIKWLSMDNDGKLHYEDGDMGWYFMIKTFHGNFPKLEKSKKTFIDKSPYL
jgi:hypothetical protein